MELGTRVALWIAFGSALLAGLLGVWLAAVVFVVAGLAVLQEARRDG